MKIECPRCGQDWVTLARIRTTGEVFQTCDECEATWPRGVIPEALGHQQLSTLLKERGLDYEAVEDLPEPEDR